MPEVLTAKWVGRIDDTNDMQRLSVREEQLMRAIERELPTLRERVPADFFLLLVVQGQKQELFMQIEPVVFPHLLVPFLPQHRQPRR